MADLSVYVVDDSLGNIEFLLSAVQPVNRADKESLSVLAPIIKEQLEIVMENAKLYYIEPDAQHKKEVQLLEYIQYIHDQINKKVCDSTTEIAISRYYKGQEIVIDESTIHQIYAILNCLMLSDGGGITTVEVKDSNDDAIHLKINLEKVE